MVGRATTLALALALALALTPGCSGDDGSTGETEAGSESETSGSNSQGSTAGPAIDPSSGSWLYVEDGVESNTCTFFDEPTNGFGTFMLMNNGDGTLTIEPQDGTGSFGCTLDGNSMTCPQRLDSEEDFNPDYDILLQSNVSVNATFSSDEAFSGTQDGTVTCVGADCALAEVVLGTALPCEFAVAFSATAL